MTKLTKNEVREIRKLRDEYAQIDIARRFHVSQPTVSQVQTRRTWKGVP